MKSVNFNYIPALDHIRFFAAAQVLVYHGIILFSGFFQTHEWVRTDNPLLSFFTEGYTAVSLFMVLSGFLFTIGAAERRINYPGFMKNRFLRIYPLFLFLTALGIYLYPADFDLLKLIKTVFLMANLPGALSLGPVSSMFWTIAVEFQFYLLFPLILGAMRRFGTVSIFAMLAAALIARIIAYQSGVELSFLWFWTLLGRIDQFLIGMLAARIFMSAGSERLKKALIPSVLLALLMTWTFNRLGGWIEVFSLKLVWPTVEGVVWAAFLLGYVSTVGRASGLVSRILSRLGEVSYSMYLLHMNVWYILVVNRWHISFSPDPVINSLVNSALIVLPATLAVSFVTYNLIERPFLRLRGRYFKEAAPQAQA